MMDKIYCYNKGNNTLHILGFCCNSNDSGYDRFYTEEDARAKYGLSVGFCRTCLDKREEELQKITKTK